MSVTTVPAAAARATAISRANPLTKLAATVVISSALVVSVDLVSAGTALAAELLVLPFAGAAWRTLGRLMLPVGLSALLGGLAAAVFGVDSGPVLAAAGPVSITEGSATTGVAMLLRVLAIALPSIALVATTDPTDLADALAQRAHLPHRFVLGALAGLRLLSVLAQEWQSLATARRARGLGGGAGPVGAARVFAGQAFALLVMAVRRAGRLAMAMEGRGFGAGPTRTWARPSTFHPRDLAVLLGAVLLATLAVGAAVAAGTWSVVWW